MWWILLAQAFGGTPVQWAISVGMFLGLFISMRLLYHLERERSAWRTTGDAGVSP